MAELDIVMPVYNEGESIASVLDSFAQSVKSSFRVLICYDHDDDDTLPAVQSYLRRQPMAIELVKNRGRGPHEAVMSGFAYSSAQAGAPWLLTYPADDTQNAGQIDAMVQQAKQGCDIVCASRFVPGGCMQGAPWLKGTLVRAASFSLRHLARLPVRDASNGLRLFSRRVVDSIAVESTAGFCYSIELLAKAHRLGWRIGEVPSRWYERKTGQSRFKVVKWLPKYLRWYFYIFATTWLRARHVPLRQAIPPVEHKTCA